MLWARVFAGDGHFSGGEELEASGMVWSVTFGVLRGVLVKAMVLEER